MVGAITARYYTVDVNVLAAPGYIHAEVEPEIETRVAEGEAEEAGELWADTEREHLDRAEAFWAELGFNRMCGLHCVRS